MALATVRTAPPSIDLYEDVMRPLNRVASTMEAADALNLAVDDALDELRRALASDGYHANEDLWTLTLRATTLLSIEREKSMDAAKAVAAVADRIIMPPRLMPAPKAA